MGFFKKVLGISTPSQPAQSAPAVRAVEAPDSLNETEQERVISNRSNQRKQRATGKRALQISTVGSNVGSNGAGTNV